MASINTFKSAEKQNSCQLLNTPHKVLHVINLWDLINTQECNQAALSGAAPCYYSAIMDIKTDSMLYYNTKILQNYML